MDFVNAQLQGQKQAFYKSSPGNVIYKLRDTYLGIRTLARIFHEYATNYLVAGMIAGIVAFTRKDSLYPPRRLPNANLF